MKKLVLSLAVFACAMAFAEEQKYVDPNPFNTYETGMKHYDGFQMAYEWQRGNNAAIEAATEEAILAAFVADEDAANRLLSNLKGAYATDPIVLTQIAAVTQWVMLPDPWYCLFWNGPHAVGREVWVAALKQKILSSTDDYIRTLCRQQLDLCE